jgi:hypothetical protein
MRSLFIRALGALSLAWWGLSSASGCSPSTGTADVNGSAGGTSSGGGAGGVGAGAVAGGGGTGLGGVGGDVGGTFNIGSGATNGGSVDGGPKCSVDVHQGERLPLDMYFLVDTSGSMGEKVQGGTKWSVISASLVSFLNDPANSDVATGIGYFPKIDPAAPKTCSTTPDCGPFGPCVGLNLFGACLGCYCAAADGCQVPGYAVPSVPLMLPPNHAAVVTDLGTHGPSGGTPTTPALTGAAQIASQWTHDNPGRTTVIVLATDGNPTGCTANSVQDIANVAAAALNATNKIKTFVIGVGSSLTALNQVAQAGGTGQAFIVDTAGDVAKAFTAALNSIRGQAVPCDFKVPTSTSSGPVDPAKVNVSFAPPGGAPAPILQTANDDPANCGTGPGWYYDFDPARDGKPPTLLKMCAASCAALTQGGAVSVELGCKTKQAVIQ